VDGHCYHSEYVKYSTMDNVLHVNHDIAARIAVCLGFMESDLYQGQGDADFVVFKIKQYLLEEYGLVHQPWSSNFKITDSKKAVLFILKYG